MFRRLCSITLVLVMLVVSTVTAFGEELQSTSEITVENLLKVSQTNDGPLSRGDFAAMLVEAARISKEEITEDTVLPQDLTADTLHAESVKALCDRNILRGFADKVFPDNSITGIEAIALIARTLGIPEDVVVDKLEISNLPKDHWGFAVYSWMIKDDLIIEGFEPLVELDAETAAQLLFHIFGTDQKVKAIIEESNEKTKDIKSFRVKGDMAIEILMEGLEELGVDMPTKTTANFKMEYANNIIHQTIETLVPILNESIQIEQYMDKDYIYMSMPDIDEENNWIKMENPVPVVFDEDFLSQQQALTKDFEELAYYRLMGIEEIDGKDCYKIAMYTRLDDLSQILDKIGMMGQQEMEALDEAGDMFKDILMNGYMYIGVEDGLVSKAMMKAVISMNEEKQIDSPVIIKAMDMEMDYNYSDYNADIEIEIPQEAINAETLDMQNTPSPEDL